MHASHTNVRYLMQTEEKPNSFVVPQLGQVRLDASLASFFTLASGLDMPLYTHRYVLATCVNKDMHILSV